VLDIEPGGPVVLGAWPVSVHLVLEFDTAVMEQVTALGAKTSDVPISEDWLRLKIQLGVVMNLDGLCHYLLDNFLYNLGFLLNRGLSLDRSRTTGSSKLIFERGDFLLSLHKSDDVGVLRLQLYLLFLTSSKSVIFGDLESLWHKVPLDPVLILTRWGLGLHFGVKVGLVEASPVWQPE